MKNNMQPDLDKLRKTLKVLLEKTLKDTNLQNTSIADRTTIQIDFSNNLDINVTLPQYSVFVDKGRKAKATPPPVAPILKWMKEKGIGNDLGIAFAISKSIGKKGIQPRPFISRFNNDLDAFINAYLDDFIANVKVELSKKINNI